MNSCSIVTDLGIVRDVLTAVDCNTRGFARAGYESLTAAGSPFQTGLTLFLTVYVAIMGYRLLFALGGARLSDGPGIALKIGAILALVTSWSVFQTLVFDMAAHAPVEIARAISAPLRSGNAIGTDPLSGLQIAYDQLSAAAAAFAKPAKLALDADRTSNATTAETLSLASNALFVASAGLIAVITVAIGVLTAVGPLFVALFLFAETRGFFVGWVRALSGAAFGLFSAWTLTVLMLHALDPWLEALSARNAAGLPDVQVAITTAVIVFVFAASQAGVFLAEIAIARGFRLSFAPRAATPAMQPIREASDRSAPFDDAISRPMRLAEQLQRSFGAYPSVNRMSAVTTIAHTDRAGAIMGTPTTNAHLGDLYRRPAVTRSEPAR